MSRWWGDEYAPGFRTGWGQAVPEAKSPPASRQGTDGAAGCGLTGAPGRPVSTRLRRLLASFLGSPESAGREHRGPRYPRSGDGRDALASSPVPAPLRRFPPRRCAACGERLFPHQTERDWPHLCRGGAA